MEFYPGKPSLGGGSWLGGPDLWRVETREREREREMRSVWCSIAYVSEKTHKAGSQKYVKGQQKINEK